MKNKLKATIVMLGVSCALAGCKSSSTQTATATAPSRTIQGHGLVSTSEGPADAKAKAVVLCKENHGLENASVTRSLILAGTPPVTQYLYRCS